MSSVTASIEIDATVDRCWRVLAEVDAYAAWHPWFVGVRCPDAAVRSGEQLDTVLRLDGMPATGLPVRFVVGEARRHRSVTWLLVRPAGSDTTAHDRPAVAGLYEVFVQDTGRGTVLVVQHLTLANAPSEHAQVEHALAAINTALRARVEQTAQATPVERPVSGSVRVSSRSGLFRHGVQQRAGLFSCIAGWVARWPRGVAA